MLTHAQLTILRADITNSLDSLVIAARGNGADIGRDDTTLAKIYNSASAFIVFKSSESSQMIGKTVNYVAFAAMTEANQNQLLRFLELNPLTFDPRRQDVATFFVNTFGGALGGQGQATRDAFEALRRRAAKRIERLYASGLGTTLAPGELTYEGEVTIDEIGRAFQN